jgi:hypothetical protein
MLADYEEEELADHEEEEDAGQISRSSSGNPPSFDRLLPKNDRLLRALSDAGLQYPSELQQCILPHMVAAKHIICSDKGGMGKTASYVLAALAQMHELGRWDTATHHMWPMGVRAGVRTTLLCAKRSESPLSVLAHAMILAVLEQIQLKGCFPDAACNLVLVCNDGHANDVMLEFERLSRYMKCTHALHDGISTIAVRGGLHPRNHDCFNASGPVPFTSPIASHTVVTTPQRAFHLLSEGHLRPGAVRLLVVDTTICLDMYHRPHSGAPRLYVESVQRLLGVPAMRALPCLPRPIPCIVPPKRHPQHIFVFNDCGRRHGAIEKAKQLVPTDRDCGIWSWDVGHNGDDREFSWRHAHESPVQVPV